MKSIPPGISLLALLTLGFAISAMWSTPAAAQFKRGFKRSQESEKPPPRVRMMSPPVYVKGFPILFQMTAWGYHVVSKMRLDSYDGDVQTTFTSPRNSSLILQGGFPEYTGTAITADGMFFSPARDNSAFQLLLGRDQTTATLLFDLTTLHPGATTGEEPVIRDFKEVPPDSYTLRGAILNYLVPLRTENSAPVEVRVPSSIEAQWLQDMEAKWREHIEMLSHDPRVNGRTLIVPDPTDSRYGRFIRLYSPNQPFHWLDFLRLPIVLPATNNLSIAAQHSLAPYLFFSKFLLTPNALETYPLEELEKFAVLPYLESEKQVWKYELLKARKLDDSSTRLRKSIELIWPGMKWRLDEVDQNKGLLKTLKEKAYVA